MGKKKLKKLWKWELKRQYPYEPKFYTRYLFFVPAPTIEQPYPCILVMKGSPSERVFDRFASLKSLFEIYNIPQVQQDLCQQALDHARETADEYIEIIRNTIYRRQLPGVMEKINEGKVSYQEVR